MRAVLLLQHLRILALSFCCDICKRLKIIIVYCRVNGRYAVDPKQEETARVGRSDRDRRAPENVDVTMARYSPAFTQQRRDVTQVRQDQDQRVLGQPGRSEPIAVTRSDASDDALLRGYTAKQKSSDDPTWRYQNGFSTSYYGDLYRVGNASSFVGPDFEMTETQRRVIGQQRGPSVEEVRYRTTQKFYDERVDTPQSGRLTQSAMAVREMFEEDGDFDQEVAVSRGAHISLFHLFIYLLTYLLTYLIDDPLTWTPVMTRCNFKYHVNTNQVGTGVCFNFLCFMFFFCQPVLD